VYADAATYKCRDIYRKCHVALRWDVATDVNEHSACFAFRATGAGVQFGPGPFFAFWRPYAGQDLAAPTHPNGGRQLCRLQFAKCISVTQVSDHINKQKHLSEIGERVAD
jgi:hypothetical protein